MNEDEYNDWLIGFVPHRLIWMNWRDHVEEEERKEEKRCETEAGLLEQGTEN
jgi:hypothetical protein